MRLLFVFAVAVSGGVAMGETVELSPTQDAMIWEANPNSNYGTSFIASAYESGWAPSLIQFDVSSYTGATLNSASLEMYCYSTFYTADSTNNVYRLTSSWNEGTVTWNNAPNTEMSILATFGLPVAGSWTTSDVTALVETWLNGSFTNEGFLFGRVTAANGGADFRSKEFTNSSYHPKLVLDYNSSALEENTWGEIKALF